MYFSLLILTLSSYASTLIPPAHFGMGVFIGFTIPFFIILNGVLFAYLIIQLKRTFLFPLVGVVAGFPFILSSISIHDNEDGKKFQISVLSFNAKLFREQNTYNEFSTEMIRWVVNESSYIKCIQEFSTNSDWDGLDVADKIEKKGYHSYAFKSSILDNEHNLGLAIFSKYEIVNTGIVWEDATSLNAIIFVDVNLSHDTLRVYNVHLSSMNIELANGMTNKSESTINKVIKGTVKRSEQVNLLIKHAKSSPYRVIICGDFNEPPYGYNYRQMINSFTNSFEKSGNGLGFTYNNAILPLRIDHQFCGVGVKAVNYSVDYKMNISDHFPTRGWYELTVQKE